jgi:3-oxo-5alpha-steroid 4-dehydrogenase
MQNRRAERAIADAYALETEVAGRRLIRARAGVVLATGGFIYETPMLDRFAAPNCAANAMALVRVGTMGCSGAGIRLGMSVGGAVGKMDNVMLGRSMAPPAALLEGVIVNAAGRRLVNEDIYAGFLGDALCRQPSAKAWLVLDSASLRRVLAQTMPSGDGNFYILKLPNLANLLFGGTRRGRTLEALAGRCGIDADGLAAEVAAYNASVSDGQGDPLGKGAEYLRPITRPPFYTLNMALSNPLAPTLSMTLGGLRVDEGTGLVQREDGDTIPGLYAVGRAAVGLCSDNYFSGMSLADCVYSGRRAGGHLAGIRTPAAGTS